MKLSPAYLKWREATLQEGIERGIKLGIERGIELGVERGLERGLERGIKLGVERGMERGLERGITLGVERGLERGMERGIKLGVERGMERGIELGIEFGIERGQVQNQRQFIENFLLARFGAIDETLAATIEPLLKLSMTEVTNLMLELSSLERDEFLARLSSDPQAQLPDSDNSM